MNANKHESVEPSGEFAASIRDFRSAVTHVAEREAGRPVAAKWLDPARKRRRAAQQRVALTWACAALLCLATLPFSIHSRHDSVARNVTPAVIAPASSPESDTALLEQVDTDVSESVPPSLAPLAELDNLTTTSSNTAGSASHRTSTPAQTESTNATR